MSRLVRLTVFLCVCTASLSIAGEKRDWKDAPGFRSSKTGLSGSILVTPDANWKKKWETSRETVPNFTSVKTVRRGQRLFILIFYAGAKRDANERVDVTCDIKITRPNGTISVDEHDKVCWRGKLKGVPSDIGLSNHYITYIGEAKDPAGEWQVRVILKDNYGKVRLPLKTSFTLE